MSTENVLLEAAVDAASRYADGQKTGPEELVGAAHAACYSMALASLLSKDGYDPDDVRTDARVDLETDEAPRVTGVHLATRGRADKIDEDRFQALAQQAKEECIVSGIFGELSVTLDASLEAPPG